MYPLQTIKKLMFQTKYLFIKVTLLQTKFQISKGECGNREFTITSIYLCDEIWKTLTVHVWVRDRPEAQSAGRLVVKGESRTFDSTDVSGVHGQRLLFTIRWSVC